MISGTIGKESTCNAFPNIGILVILKNTQFFIVDIDFNSLHQTNQLIFYVSSSSKRTNLHKILSAPLIAVLKLFPGIVNIQQC